MPHKYIATRHKKQTTYDASGSPYRSPKRSYHRNWRGSGLSRRTGRKDSPTLQLGAGRGAARTQTSKLELGGTRSIKPRPHDVAFGGCGMDRRAVPTWPRQVNRTFKTRRYLTRPSLYVVPLLQPTTYCSEEFPIGCQRAIEELASFPGWWSARQCSRRSCCLRC